MKLDISEDDIEAHAAMVMVNTAPNTAEEVAEGIVRFLDGFIIRDEDAAPNGEKVLLTYMGVELDREQLMSREELFKHLNENGMDDKALGGIREQQYEQYRQELIWRYSLSDGNSLGGFILPVKEGFLWLPYRSSGIDMLDTTELGQRERIRWVNPRFCVNSKVE